MIDDNFCSALEAKLSHGFAASEDPAIRLFWCDGVLLPLFERDLWLKSVNDRREIPMSAFTGPTGQEKYELILKLGPKSLSRYARQLDLEYCLSELDTHDWLEVDIVNKILFVYLP
jgi:hypothetical protein